LRSSIDFEPIASSGRVSAGTGVDSVTGCGGGGAAVSAGGTSGAGIGAVAGGCFLPQAAAVRVSRTSAAAAPRNLENLRIVLLPYWLQDGV
jgi:hypothetical protein